MYAYQQRTHPAPAQLQSQQSATNAAAFQFQDQRPIHAIQRKCCDTIQNGTNVVQRLRIHTQPSHQTTTTHNPLTPSTNHVVQRIVVIAKGYKYIITHPSQVASFGMESKVAIMKALQQAIEEDMPPNGNWEWDPGEKKEAETLLEYLVGNISSNRSHYIPSNPQQKSMVGRTVKSRSLLSPYPYGDKGSEDKQTKQWQQWVDDPSRRMKDEHTGKTFTGDWHLGHKEDAAKFWNRTGHTQTWDQLKQHQSDPNTFQVEEPSSNMSHGSGGVVYQKPTKHKGSHPSWWDPKDPNYKGPSSNHQFT